MNPHRVHFIYLVPTDRVVSAVSAIADCMQNLQAWYRWQMGNGKTFTLATVSPETFVTGVPAIWYSTNPVPGAQNADLFWLNSIAHARQFAGADFFMEYDDWVVYVDAPIGAGQYCGGASGGFISGIAVLPEQDVRAVQGLDTVYTRCREYGGCGHELGHTFGLDHPDGDPQYDKAIMGTGYGLYPDAILTQSEKNQLNTNPFFDAMPHVVLNGYCQFTLRPVPGPRARVTPHPRP